mgnify:CR=1 FL=1
MPNIIVIGAGLAGLSAAVHLAKKNHNIKLIEATPKLGGRTYSFYDDKSGLNLDNGQHIMVGCYKFTLDFLRTIGALHKLEFQENLKVVFIDTFGKKHNLESTNFIYPLNLFFGILDYSAVSIFDRINILIFAAKLFLRLDKNELFDSIDKWLLFNNQNEKINKALWEIIAIGALNTSLQKGSPKIFASILREIFFTGNFSSTIIVPKTDLSELFCSDAENFLLKKNCEVNKSERLTEIIFENKIAVKLITDKNVYSEFDYCILALPSYAMNKVKNIENVLDLNSLNYSTSGILTFHIFLKENKLQEKFYGLIDSPIHWVFNHKEYLTLVTSDADEIITKENEELFDIAAAELKQYLGIERANIIRYQVVKEKRATVIPDNNFLRNRPTAKTSIENLFLAGDWTATDLPSTIEGAIKSGKIVSEIINSK